MQGMPPKAATHMVRSKVSKLAVRDALVGESGVPSNFGQALERAHAGGVRSTDYARAKGAQESRLLEHAAVVRCIDALEATPNLYRTREACAALTRLQTRLKVGEGALVIGILRAYQPWATLVVREDREKERAKGMDWRADPNVGLAELYAWLQRRDAAVAEPVLGKYKSLVEAFRAGKAAHARKYASEVLADAYVALDGWVEAWNARSAAGAGRPAAA